MNRTTEIPKRLDEFRAALEPQRVLHPNECGLVHVPAGVDAQIEYPTLGGMIPKGPWNRQKPTALGGELPSYGGQPRILGGMGRYYAESLVDSNATMDLSTDWDEFTIRMGPECKRWKIKAATAKTTAQTLAWTRTLLEQLTQTEMEVSAAKFNISLRGLKIKGPK
jgi:hypothetical protein